ncbi:LpqB family beta-propeller domain-containing protein [Kribbella sp. NPDC049227]|uniref:LpqB family beta-propeller domain-containing protein n=1 Tax=Kribbella sp. NPDC049227 TaxID=3364113 RepID=UPI00371DF900
MKRRLLGAVLALTLLVTGCATVPTQGNIRQGSREGLTQGGIGVGVEAKPPRDNLTEVELVNGFLEAMSDSRAFDVARQYMTADAAAAWKPETRTIVYDQRPGSLSPQSGSGVKLTARKIATVDERGEWIPAAPGADRADFLFKVAKVDGQLRVASVPPGVYLGSNQVDLKLAPRDLYFFNPGRELLVPDPVYLPVNQSQGQAATQLIQELLKGPTKSLGNGVVSLAPPGTEVQVSVPVEFGVATVALNDTAAALRDQDRRLLAAQIVWTLNQINLRARITVGGAPLLPDDPDVLPFTNFSQYDPSVPGGAMTTLYGLRQGRVQRVEGLDGASDIAARPLDSSLLHGQIAESFAVSLRGDSGAIVTTIDGEKVVAYGPLDNTDNSDKTDDLVRIKTQGTVLRPSYDNDDNLWIMDRADKATPRLRVRNRDGKLTAVTVSFRGDTPLVLRMAPDGVRALLVMRSKATGKTYVETGAIQTGPDGKQLLLGSLRKLELALTDMTDAAWNKQGVLVAGASGSASNADRAPWLVNPDGSKLQLLPGASTDFITQRLASNPNKDTLPAVEDVDGHVHWQTRDLTWTAMEDDANAIPFIPVYPG